jgi:hypothetical protein
VLDHDYRAVDLGYQLPVNCKAKLPACGWQLSDGCSELVRIRSNAQGSRPTAASRWLVVFFL